MPLDTSDLGRLGLLSTAAAVAGRLDWKDARAGTLLGSATFWLSAIEDDNSRQLVLRLSAELDPDSQVHLFKLDRVAIGCAPRWLLVCPQCGEQRASRLFLPAKAKAFGCKRCHDLMYRSVQRHDRRVDRVVQRLRAGDISVVDELSLRGRQPGYQGYVADRLLLAAVAKLSSARAS